MPKVNFDRAVDLTMEIRNTRQLSFVRLLVFQNMYTCVASNHVIVYFFFQLSEDFKPMLYAGTRATLHIGQV